MKIKPYRKTDDSEWPPIRFVGVRGWFRATFFDMSLGWGTKPRRTGYIVTCPPGEAPGTYDEDD